MNCMLQQTDSLIYLTVTHLHFISYRNSKQLVLGLDLVYLWKKYVHVSLTLGAVKASG